MELNIQIIWKNESFSNRENIQNYLKKQQKNNNRLGFFEFRL